MGVGGRRREDAAMGSEGKRPVAAASTAERRDVSPALEDWLAAAGLMGPYGLSPLAGGNSNETMLLRAGGERLVMRRPPRATIDSSAHNVGREAQMLEALAPSVVPVPAPRGLCVDAEVPEAPFLLMDAVDGVSLGDEVPAVWAGEEAAAVSAVGEATVDALADLHTLDWRAIGLADFGRPQDFLARQVPRWRKQLSRYAHRELVDFEPVAELLEAKRPADVEPGILHGDFHVDNCLFTIEGTPRLAAIIDWEMSTIGDPLLDVGLFLGFWGNVRTTPMGMPWVQAISRVPGAIGRQELARRYEARSGRSLEHLPYYMALAFWKLAAIVEGAHAHFVAGRTEAPYAAALEHDVPALLGEARWFIEQEKI
jgi:aminoglycoside phosphotransferase (APT) family kinase protein